MSYKIKKKITPWCILLVPMACTVWLKYYPILSAFYISLFQYDPINPPGKFVGLENYKGMFLSLIHIFLHREKRLWKNAV